MKTNLHGHGHGHEAEDEAPSDVVKLGMVVKGAGQAELWEYIK